MRKIAVDIAVIGGGAAGLSAGAAAAEQGCRTWILERDQDCGGVLMQCIHTGFGIHYFGEELTGPEYAERLLKRVRHSGAEICCNASVTAIRKAGADGRHYLTVLTPGEVWEIDAGAVILAAGCRERHRGNLATPGDRCAGIFTAGTAQRLMNIDGVLPGTSAVIAGSGDIGLIMARRLTWCGIQVKAVTEIRQEPSGLARNVAQCLDDFGIPLKLRTALTRINGRERVESVCIAPLDEAGNPDLSREEKIICDTVLFSVGLIPDTALVQKFLKLDPKTSGPVTDEQCMTGDAGLFACGNVRKVHDLADSVSREAEQCARYAAAFCRSRGRGDAV